MDKTFICQLCGQEINYENKNSHELTHCKYSIMTDYGSDMNEKQIHQQDFNLQNIHSNSNQIVKCPYCGLDFFLSSMQCNNTMFLNHLLIHENEIKMQCNKDNPFQCKNNLFI